MLFQRERVLNKFQARLNDRYWLARYNLSRRHGDSFDAKSNANDMARFVVEMIRLGGVA